MRERVNGCERILPGENRGYRRVAEDGAKAPGEGVTRHPGAGAAKQRGVAVSNR